MTSTVAIISLRFARIRAGLRRWFAVVVRCQLSALASLDIAVARHQLSTRAIRWGIQAQWLLAWFVVRYSSFAYGTLPVILSNLVASLTGLSS